MSGYLCTITQVTIHRQGDNPLTTPEATVVCLDDMGGGHFLSLSQTSSGSEGQVLLDPEELPCLQQAAAILLEQPSLGEAGSGGGLTAEQRAQCLEVLRHE